MARFVSNIIKELELERAELNARLEAINAKLDEMRKLQRELKAKAEESPDGGEQPTL